MEKNKNIAKVIALTLIFVGILYQGAVFLFDYGYSSAKNEIRSKLERDGIITPLPVFVSYVTARVNEVDDSTKTLDVLIFKNYDPLFDSNLKQVRGVIRTVGDTEVVRRISSNQSPEGYVDTKIQFVDIKPGDQVGLVSTENILNKKDFQVSKIVVLE